MGKRSTVWEGDISGKTVQLISGLLVLVLGIALTGLVQGVAMWLALGQSAVGAVMVGHALRRDHRAER